MSSLTACVGPCQGLRLPPRQVPPMRPCTSQVRLGLAAQPPRASAGQEASPPPTSIGGLAREKRLAGVSAKYRALYQKAWEGNSRKAAIRAFCLECVGWSENEVRLCKAPACPLFEFRELG